MNAAETRKPDYFVPQPSPYPAAASLALLFLAMGLAFWLNKMEPGRWLTLAGVLGLLLVLFRWFGAAIRESESGLYGKRVDGSYRWSMKWFIFSEAMFFGAFFAALFYVRVVTGSWRTPLGPFPIPTLNTVLLLASGATLTVSHHALAAGRRGACAAWLALTVLLGAAFVCLQGFEYFHAYTELDLKPGSGVYASLFYILTGFHGFHVTLGAIMLAVVLRRVLRGDFTPEHHFGFRGVSWYWHFVDVVWLALYVFVYWL